MEVLVLAAGYATRLYPLTEQTPKPLLKVGDKTIIEHILAKLERLEDINRVYLVTNDKFYPHFASWSKTFKTNLIIKIINDGTKNNEDRLGAIGDIHQVIEMEKINDDLLIIGGDNLFNDDLKDFISFFQKNGSTVMLHDVQSLEVAKQLGIASLDAESRINSFIEKPENPPSTLASTLIYALQKNHLPFVTKALAHGKADRAGDFIKFLSEQQPVYGKLLQGKWFDVGTFESLEEAKKVYERCER